MSSGTSPGGVSALRARFEQESGSSPPSRGRSPADSVASDTSRPLSKVRSSFVAVEPSGHKLEVPNTDGASMSTKNSTSPSPRRMDGKSNGNAQHESTVNPDKPASAAEENAPKMLPGDSKPKDFVEEGADGGDLGSILKGSPFEGVHGKDSSAKQKDVSTKKPAQASKETPARTDLKTAAKQAADKAQRRDTEKAAPKATLKETAPAAVNGKPRDGHKTQPVAKDMASATASKTAAKAEPSSTAPKKEDTLRHSSKKPVPISSAQTPSTSTREKKSLTKPAAPAPAKDTKRPPKAASPSTSDPKEPVPAPKASHPAPSSTKPTGSRHVSTESSGTGFVKPKPKSPTRPAKLPAAAMASTTSSAAKHDPAPPSNKPTSSSSKPASANASQGTASATGFIKPRPKSPTRPSKLPAGALATTASSAAKHDADTEPATKPSHRPVRASLPAASRPLDKVKAKPRTSMAGGGGGGGGGGFLDRMMRPTTSSAQKTLGKEDSKPLSQSQKPKAGSKETANESKAEQPRAAAASHASPEKEESKPSALQEAQPEQSGGTSETIEKDVNASEKPAEPASVDAAPAEEAAPAQAS